MAQVAQQVVQVEVAQVTLGEFVHYYSQSSCLKDVKLEIVSHPTPGEFHIGNGDLKIEWMLDKDVLIGFRVQNITYMCAKVNATVGCYHQKYISGLDVEVCVCESQLGAMPCNNTTKLANKLSRAVLLTIAINTFITLYHKIFKYS
uniref:Uncharacterized protein n=1 Tax=Glossina palpalis gambiensis TaxID=67801 RepID=A0A1B0B807_9MUSC